MPQLVPLTPFLRNAFSQVKILKPRPLKFEPEKWNQQIPLAGVGLINGKPMTFQQVRNCYVYALNVADMKAAIPGELGIKYLSSTRHKSLIRPGFNNHSITKWEERVELVDGLTRIAKPSGHTDDHVLCMITPNGTSPEWAGFHFLRYDTMNRCWSHKPGMSAATQCDLDDRLIFDPEKSNLVPDQVNCNFFYFKVPAQGISYVPSLLAKDQFMYCAFESLRDVKKRTLSELLVSESLCPVAE